MTAIPLEDSTSELDLPRGRAALATLCFVLFLTFLDNTIVSVVLAGVQSSLHVGVAGLQWVVNGYALVFASLMLTMGTLGDLFGRKKVMLAGVAVFCTGSVIGAVATSDAMLVGARVVMGLGAAASEPGTLSMIRHLYPDHRDRARALGVWAAVAGVALAMGPVIGGTLQGLYSWRAVFWFNLFFGILALVGAAVTLPENSDPQNRRLDVGGFLLGAVALASVSFAVIDGEISGYRAWWIAALFALSAVSTALFVLFERRAGNPVLNVRYFSRRPFSGSNVVAFTAYFSIFALFFLVALYVELIGSSSGYQTALDFVPMALAMVVAALFTGRWVAYSGPRWPMTAGCLLAAVGVFLTEVNLSPSAGLSSIGWTMAMAGAGFGMAIVPVTSSALAVIPPEHSGMAASMTNTSREMGALAGVAVLGSIINGQLTVALAQKLHQLGIPSSFISLVVTAVTTGTFTTKSARAISRSNHNLAVIVAKIQAAAHAAATHGIDIALYLSAAAMVASAVVALVTMTRPHRPLDF